MNCSAPHRQLQMSTEARDPDPLKPLDFQAAYDGRRLKRELLHLILGGGFVNRPSMDAAPVRLGARPAAQLTRSHHFPTSFFLLSSFSSFAASANAGAASCF